MFLTNYFFPKKQENKIFYIKIYNIPNFLGEIEKIFERINQENFSTYLTRIKNDVINSKNVEIVINDDPEPIKKYSSDVHLIFEVNATNEKDASKKWDKGDLKNFRNAVIYFNPSSFCEPDYFNLQEFFLFYNHIPLISHPPQIFDLSNLSSEQTSQIYYLTLNCYHTCEHIDRFDFMAKIKTHNLEKLEYFHQVIKKILFDGKQGTYEITENQDQVIYSRKGGPGKQFNLLHIDINGEKNLRKPDFHFKTNAHVDGTIFATFKLKTPPTRDPKKTLGNLLKGGFINSIESVILENKYGEKIYFNLSEIIKQDNLEKKNMLEFKQDYNLNFSYEISLKKCLTKW